MNRQGSLIALMSALALAGVSRAADTPPVPVIVTEARMESIGAKLTATGTVVSRNDARISGEVGGTLAWIAEPATIETMRVHQSLFVLALQDEAIRERLAGEFARWRAPFVTLFRQIGEELRLDGFDAASVGEAFAVAADGLVQQQSLDPGLATARVKAIMAEPTNMFHPTLLRRFINIVGMYPVGTLVVLNTDEVGIVAHENPTDPFRPQVRVVFSAHGERLDEPRAAVDHDVADRRVGEQLFQRPETEKLVDQHLFQRELLAAVEVDLELGQHFRDDRTEFFGQLVLAERGRRFRVDALQQARQLGVALHHDALGHLQIVDAPSNHGYFYNRQLWINNPISALDAPFVICKAVTIQVYMDTRSVV